MGPSLDYQIGKRNQRKPKTKKQPVMGPVWRLQDMRKKPKKTTPSEIPSMGHPRFPIVLFVICRYLPELMIHRIYVCVSFKHCQRHNRPEGWGVLNKVIAFKSFHKLVKIQLPNLDQTSVSKSWPNFSFKISTELWVDIFTSQVHINQVSTTLCE